MKYFFTLLIAFLVSQLNYGQVDLTSGLVAYYPFNGNANDASGNGNNAIFNNATLTTGVNGAPNSAYQFDGATNYIQIPNSPSLNVGNKITLSAFVKVEGFYYGLCHGNDILNKGQHSGNLNAMLLRFDDASYTNSTNCLNPIPDTLHETFHGVNNIVTNEPFIVKDQWYSVIYTYDGTSTNFYVDGLLIQSNNNPGITFNNSEDLYLGRLFDPASPSSFPYWFNGVMDEVRIYNRAVNNDEVAALSQLSVLPVSLTTFRAAVQDPGNIKLNWSTENEENIQGYYIERSYDGTGHFNRIGYVAAKPGTGNTYTYIDNGVRRNVPINYRIVVKDKSGTFKYSDIRLIRYSTSKGQTITVFPNPSHGLINLIVNGFSGNANVVIHNLVGATIFKKTMLITDGVPVNTNLIAQPRGVYQVKIETDQGNLNSKIVLE